MTTKYYSPDPENMFDHAYPPLKFVYTDRGNIQDAYTYNKSNKGWHRLSHMSREFYQQWLHTHCYQELTDEEAFLYML